jgi:hypothetical protein
MQIDLNVDILPFEKYIHSVEVDEYKKDIKKKNLIIKYMDLLVIDPYDNVCLNRLISNFLLLKNVFCKDACLEFFLCSFTEEQLKLISKIVFDMFVVDTSGQICEYKEFYKSAIKINKSIDYRSPLLKTWEEIKITKI